MSRSHHYRGHRAHTYYPVDPNEVVEIRARQRTFDGAYARTALGNLGYALAILKLFDRRFAKIGLLYVILAVLLFVCAFVRAQDERHQLSDEHRDERDEDAVVTKGNEDKPVLGPPYRTAGWMVVAITGIVAAVEVGVLVLVMKT